MTELFKRCCISFFILFLFFFTKGQTSRQYSFTHYSAINGLASNTINSIAQDEEGFLWFATINGLHRYDGYRFLNFRMAKSQNGPVQIDNIRNIYIDKKDNLWIVNNKRNVGIFNVRTFIYQEVPITGAEKGDNNPVKFLETAKGDLFMQDLLGATFLYDAKLGKLVARNDLMPAPKGWRKSNIAWDKALQKYWIECDSGLVLYNPATKLLSYRGHNIENDALIQAFGNELNIQNLFIDKNGNVNFYAWPPFHAIPYLYFYNRQTKEKQKIILSQHLNISYHEISGFLEQRSGRLWIYGFPFLTEWQNTTNTFLPVANEYRNEQSIKFDRVNICFEDGERNVWVGTDNGLFLFNPEAQKFNSHYLQRANNSKHLEASVLAVFQTKNENIFVGSWGTGLYYYDKNLNPIPLPQSLQKDADVLSVWDIHEHSKSGKIWFLLQSGGLIVYNPKTGSVQRDFPAIFEKRTIRQVVEDKNGNLWFGTQAGAIITWDYEQSGDNATTGYSFFKRTGLVHKMVIDNKGFIWAATLSQGLLKIDPLQFKVVKTITGGSASDTSISTNSITDVMQYNDSLMVVISGDVNLVHTSTYKVKHISTAEGLPANTAQCVEKDNKGNLWLGMTNGICRANLEKSIFTWYDRRDGIFYDNFKTAGAHRLNNNHLVFGTEHNFLVFDPQQFVQSNSTPPDPDFTFFRLGNTPLLVDSLLKDGKVVLPYNNNAVSIEYSVLSFLKQKQPYYEYMMENLDDEWIRKEESNQAIYNYLPPGKYLFKVRSVNQDGVYSKNVLSLPIIVNPPFWRSWWFYGCCVLLGIVILYFIDKERLKRIRTLQHVRVQIADNLHDEINVALNDINLLSEIAKIKADRDIERSKDYIDQISTKSRTMIESMDDMLWSIDPENDIMEKMLLRLKEYTDGIQRTYNTEIDVSIDHELKHVSLEMKAKHDFMHFYKAALHYIIYHSVSSTVFVSFESIRSKLHVKILAQCNKASHEDVTTLAYKNEMEKRAGSLGGQLELITDKKSVSIILQLSI